MEQERFRLERSVGLNGSSPNKVCCTNNRTRECQMSSGAKFWAVRTRHYTDLLQPLSSVRLLCLAETLTAFFFLYCCFLIKQLG